jgi:hypothetical protein
MLEVVVSDDDPFTSDVWYLRDDAIGRDEGHLRCCLCVHVMTGTDERIFMEFGRERMPMELLPQ